MAGCEPTGTVYGDMCHQLYDHGFMPVALFIDGCIFMTPLSITLPGPPEDYSWGELAVYAAVYFQHILDEQAED